MMDTSNLLRKMLLADLAPFISPDREIFRNSDASPEVVAATLLATNFAKKFVEDISPTADQRAYEKFLGCVKTCSEWTYTPQRTIDEVVLGEVRKHIYKFFYRSGVDPIVSSLQEIVELGDVGPGASLGAMGTDFYTKLFSSRLTATSKRLYRVYYDYVSRFPTWKRAEDARILRFGTVDVAEASRMSFVPKTNDESRSIATEPSLNMFFQKGLSAILERRLAEYFGINLEYQQHRNRELARLGSIDGHLATIDLSSASDTISYELVRLIMPPNFLRLFDELRCKYTTYNGEQVELSMISTMGNAFTFPLQTLIFSSIVLACSTCFGIPLSRRADLTESNWGVNGDDIIVPVNLARIVKHYFSFFGFSVNASKSFDEGWFRESCGGDYYRGYDVRSVYLKRLVTKNDFYSLINLLNMWSAKTGIFLPTLVRYLVSQVRYLPIPPWAPISNGIRVPRQLAPKRFDCNQSYVYFELRGVSQHLIVRSDREEVVGSSRHRVFNLEGLIMAALRGDLRRHKIPIRGSQVNVKARRMIAPNWEVIHGTEDNLWAHRQRWNSAVHFNLEID